MIPFAPVELACLATAVVLETALLLALFDRRNWARTPLPLVLVILGAWLWHAASVAERTISPPGSPAEWTSRLLMAAGLLLIPSAMLHALARLQRTGLATGLPADPRHGALYLPLLLLMPIGAALARSPGGSFLAALEGWVAPYAVWLSLVNVATGAAMLRARPAETDRSATPRHAARFLRVTAGLLFALAIAQPFVLLYARSAWPAMGPWQVLAISLSPLALAIPFAYYVSQFNVMRLVLERSLVYAVLLVAVWLVHQILFAGLRAQLRDHYRLDLEVLEALVLAALVLAYPPARRRAAEALRYLFGSRVDRVRQRMRQLSIDLAGQTGQNAEQVLQRFVGDLREGLEVEGLGLWRTDGEPQTFVSGASAANLAEIGPGLLHEMASAGQRSATRRTAASPAIFDAIDLHAASLAVRIANESFEGLLLVGRRTRNRPLSEEETNGVILLAEQLAAVLAAGRLLEERAEAERRALQNERLTMLGLLASSIAHEVKNPLSSIRTIAAVLSETLGPASPHAEDLGLIVGEADRLTASVQQLLSVVRPKSTEGPIQVETVLESTLDLVRFSAQERGVAISAEIAHGLRPVRAEEAALREIFLNLLTNSIDAAGDRGQVQIDCGQQNGHVVATFRDTGPGLSPAMQQQLFQPFHTTKPNGSGLGLFITHRRVQECGGTIACESSPGDGACFVVSLPFAASTESPA